MNNEHFRSLYSDQDKRENPQSSSITSRSSLGNRNANRQNKNSSDSGSSSFAQSVRERSSFLKPKQFKTSDPKGSKIASGFVDRARERAHSEAETKDERAKQIADLEDQLKQKKISRAEFETARDAITDGDISATHLVKGLDRRLLERIRQGEDVMSSATTDQQELDDELDKLADAEVAPVQRPASIKQGAPSNLAVGRKRTRDEIMAEMKAQRKAAEEARTAAEPNLDRRWRSTNERQTSRIEIDKKGREVLIIVDEDGIVKRKLRKPVGPEPVREEQVIGRNVAGEVLGADIKVPQQPQPVSEQHNNDDDDDDDIFAGVGTEYDPLGAEEDVSGSDAEDGDSRQPALLESTHETVADERPARPRNYFNEKGSHEVSEHKNHFSSVEAVIAKAAKLVSTTDEAADPPEDTEAARRRAKLAAMLDTRDRDMDDMDLGFGASRFEDGDDEQKAIYLSEWSGVKEGRKPRKQDDDSRKRHKKKR